MHTKYIRNIIITLLCLSSVFFIASCTHHEALTKTASYVDKDKFSGRWYTISNIPYFAEKGKVASMTTYNRVGPNSFEDIYY